MLMIRKVAGQMLDLVMITFGWSVSPEPGHALDLVKEVSSMVHPWRAWTALHSVCSVANFFCLP